MVLDDLIDFIFFLNMQMPLADLKKHILDHGIEHLELISDVLKLIQGKPASLLATLHKADFEDEKNATGQSFGRFGDDNERGGASTLRLKAKGSLGNQDNVRERESSQVVTDDGLGSSTVASSVEPQTGIYNLKDLTKLMIEMDERLTSELRRKDKEISSLMNLIRGMKKSRQSKHHADRYSSSGDVFPLALATPSPQPESTRNLRMSIVVGSDTAHVTHGDPHAIADDLHLDEYAYRRDIQKLEMEIRQLQHEIDQSKSVVQVRESFLCQQNYAESCNKHDTMISKWKISSFSQKMSDAQTGKKTSIYSLPFSLKKYKLCLQLFIMGDGIGKNSHMSLFFVIMKGEFDNTLQWPFTHKVTFKLVNQTGGRDIIDTIQPDPICKPESDMNIALGCPLFVPHTQLVSGGFIVDDTVLIECSMDV